MQKKITIFYFLLILLHVCIGSCETNQSAGKDGNAAKNGLVISKHKNGRVKAEVNYVNGKRDGAATEYYDNGNVRMTLHYKNGLKEGVAKWYYEDASGKLYQETPYLNNLINGTRKRYARTGTLIAEIPYYKGKKGIGVKEYDNKGKLVEKYANTSIKVTPNTKNFHSKSEYVLEFQFAPTRNKAKFYFSYEGLTDNAFLNDSFKPVNMHKGVGRLGIKVAKGEVLNNDITILGEFKSHSGITHLIQKSYSINISK